MDLTLEIDDKLAADLRTLAQARGLSVNELGRRALQAGLEQFAAPLSQFGIVDLGPLHATPPSAEQIARQRSPIIALGPLREQTLKSFDVLVNEMTSDAD